MNPTPLPLTTLRLQVFNDNAPVDGTYEVDAEPGLAGFTASLTDVLGTVSTDYYGNALCTVYRHAERKRHRPDAVRRQQPADHRHDPVHRQVRQQQHRADHDPEPRPEPLRRDGHPAVAVAGQTYQWVQTTTLEGGHDHDIWQQEGETGYDTEQTKGAELVPSVQFGFVRTQAITLPAGTCRPVRSRASPSPACLTSAGRTARSSRRPASPARSPAARSRTRGSRCPTSTQATRRSTSGGATPTAASTSRTCPTAPTS